MMFPPIPCESHLSRRGTRARFRLSADRQRSVTDHSEALYKDNPTGAERPIVRQAYENAIQRRDEADEKFDLVAYWLLPMPLVIAALLAAIYLAGRWVGRGFRETA
jgi:hypothetical protein